MMGFLVASAALLFIVLVYLWWSLWRPAPSDRQMDREANTRIYQERAQEIECFFHNSEIDVEEKNKLDAENARRLLAEFPEERGRYVQQRKSNVGLVVFTAVVIPVLCVGLYLHFGALKQVNHWIALTSGKMQHGESNMTDAMLILRTRLKNDPDDVEGWYMLGRSYMSLNSPNEAMQAFATAHRLDRAEVEYLVAYAQSLRMVDSEGGLAEVDRLLSQALTLDPDHEGARILTSYRALEKGEFETALIGFKWIRDRRSGDAETISMLDGLIKQANDALSQSSTLSSTAKPFSKAAKPAEEDSSPSINITVSISAELAAQVSPSAKLFVYAKADDGPPLPVAVVVLERPQFPLTLTLSDANAMNASVKLSDFSKVHLIARVSQSGKVEPRAGDLQGKTASFEWRTASKQKVIITESLK